MKSRVLLVDDDSNILAAFKRNLRPYFEIVTAEDGVAGVAALKDQGPFAVVVSDLRMPEMDGIQFLAAARQVAPDTVRVMLTGYADLQTAIDAVNKGSIFRFLSKPCSPEDFRRVVEAAVEQYRLVIAERELLDKTLRGSIKMLVDILSMLNPVAVNQASRLRNMARRIGMRLQVKRLWELELAAMLSQIGYVTIPPNILEKRAKGEPLTEKEERVFLSCPQVGRDLLSNIPRLEGVAEAIAYQLKQYDGGGFPEDDRKGKAIPFIARVLKVVLDYDALVQAGKTVAEAVAIMRAREAWYDPAVLGALEAESLAVGEGLIVRSVSLDELLPGMVLAENITDGRDVILVPKGYEISEVLKTRLLNFARFGTVSQPIKVLEKVS
ncbi:MAG TPA: response regulator [Desulfotomaculum sp.]|nr:response regulator [Desulfotomaculum sp.]